MIIWNFSWWFLTLTAIPQLMLNRKWYQVYNPEMEFHMINIPLCGIFLFFEAHCIVLCASPKHIPAYRSLFESSVGLEGIKSLMFSVVKTSLLTFFLELKQLKVFQTTYFEYSKVVSQDAWIHAKIKNVILFSSPSTDLQIILTFLVSSQNLQKNSAKYNSLDETS